MTMRVVIMVIMAVRLRLSGGPQPILLNLDGVPPMPISHLRDVRLHRRETFYSLVKLEQRANVVLFIRHARRLLTDLFISVKSKTQQGGYMHIYMDGKGGVGTDIL